MYSGNIDTISNRADWDEVIVLTDEDTGEQIDISQCRITVSVARAQRNPNFYSSGYYYDYPVPGYPNSVVLTGSTDTGEITLPDVGTFQWSFPYTRVNALAQGEYVIGVRISQSGTVMQLFAGTLKVFEGIDMQ